MKIALIGPAHGHNIQPFLKYLNGLTSNNAVDFFFHGKDSFSEEYKNLNFIKIFTVNSLKTSLSNVSQYDVIWLMGGGRLVYIIPFFFLFTKAKCKTILHVWSESLPRLANKNSLKGRFTAFFLSFFNLINCNWYGTSKILETKFPKTTVVNPLGLTMDYFKEATNPDVEILKLIKLVDNDTYNFYYPKSFTESSRHDIIINAAADLKTESIKSFKIYFWEGNVVDDQRKKEMIALIKKHNLQDVVILLKKVKFFSFEDINLLWKKMDCGLQIAQFDQLSNTIFEPLINKKDLIISDIPPYHFISDFFDFKLPLTPLKIDAVKEQMKLKIQGKNRASDLEKQNRLEKIKEKYIFEKSLSNFLLKLENQEF